MGHISIITVHHENRLQIVCSPRFGAAIASAVKSAQRPSTIMLGKEEVGSVLFTTKEEKIIEQLVVDGPVTGILSVAWIFHDNFPAMKGDSEFGKRFTELMYELPLMSTDQRLPVDATAKGDTTTGGYIFFNLEPHYRVKIDASNSRAHVVSYSVK